MEGNNAALPFPPSIFIILPESSIIIFEKTFPTFMIISFGKNDKSSLSIH